MANLTKKGKITLASILVSLSAIAVAGCVTPYVVNKKNDKNIVSNLHSSSFYTSLTADEQAEFDKDFDSVKTSDYYKSLKKEEKIKLAEKFLASKEVEKELRIVDKNPDEIVIDSNMSEQEIKAAQLQKAYWEIVAGVKNSLETNYLVNHKKITPIKVNAIYDSSKGILTFVDFAKSEKIGGRVYFSKYSTILLYDNCRAGETEDYKSIIEKITKDTKMTTYMECENFNSEKNADYFDLNKYLIGSNFSELEGKGNRIQMIESWETSKCNVPNFIVKSSKNNSERYFLMRYHELSNSYTELFLYKVCPEFWAYKEENAKSQSANQVDEQTQNIITSINSQFPNYELSI